MCFYSRNGDARYYRGRVLRRMKHTATVRFREFDDTYLTYSIAFNRIFDIAPETAPPAPV